MASTNQNQQLGSAPCDQNDRWVDEEAISTLKQGLATISQSITRSASAAGALARSARGVPLDDLAADAHAEQPSAEDELLDVPRAGPDVPRAASASSTWSSLPTEPVE